MRRVFVDTGYFIAKLNPRDKLHASARRAENSLSGARLVTTEMVLAELLAYYARHGEHLRRSAIHLCDILRVRQDVELLPQTSDLFRRALAVYRKHPDKDWSLVDSASIVVMHELDLNEVLGADHHFEQAGFRILMSSR